MLYRRSTNEVFDQSSLFLNCNYYDTISLNSQILNRSITNDLFFIHLNIRSLQKNIDKLTHYISQFHKLPDIIAITKTKLRNDTIYNNIDIAKYNYIHADSLTKEGGVGFYIKNSLSYTVKPEYDLNLNFVENIWIQVDTDKNSILIGVIYRHPVNIVNQLELFSRTIEEKFFNLSNSKSEFYILGDFNIDLLQVTNNRVIKNYADNLVDIQLSVQLTNQRESLITRKHF